MKNLFKNRKFIIVAILIFAIITAIVTIGIKWIEPGAQLAQLSGGTPATIIIDNLDASAQVIGTWTTSPIITPYIGSNYLTDGNADKGAKRVIFTPTIIDAGSYDVYITYSIYSNRSTNTPVDITSSSGTDTVTVNQQINAGWNLLGNYNFDAGTGGNVTIRTDNTNGYVVVDAAKFVPTSSSPPPPPPPPPPVSTPTISSISPSSGTTVGGTNVTITGTGFVSGAAVSVGGTSATSVIIASSTTITATTPVGAAGAQNVVVTNSDTGTITLTGGFTYVASITPPPPPPTGDYYIEHINSGNTPIIFSPSTASVPAKNVPFLDKDTGASITRLSDVSDGAPFSSKNGNPAAGFTNGYAKYSNVNSTGQYMLAFSTALYQISDGQYIGPLYLYPTGSQILDSDGNEVRWSRMAGEETIIYYHDSAKLYQQDVLLGRSSIHVVHDFSVDYASYFSQGYLLGSGPFSYAEGDWSNDGRYFAFRVYHYVGSSIVDNFIFVYDLQTNVVLPGKIFDWPNAVDVSPDGKWLVILPHQTPSNGDHTRDNRFYRISDLAQNIINSPIYVPSALVNNVRSIGHNGWALDYNGGQVFVYQDNRDDGWKTFNMETGESITVFQQPDLGGYTWGSHESRMTNINTRGWFLMPTNHTGTTVWGADQILMVEIKPRAQHPRIWRIASTNTNLATGGYWAEAFASIDVSGNNIYWGSNWNGRDNLEVYRVQLPDNWAVDLGGTPPPPPPCTPSWSCTVWSACLSSNTQTRICNVTNACDATTGRPVESQSCTYAPPSLNLSAENQIISFGFTNPSVNGLINNANYTIALTVPLITNVTNLTPVITISTGATIFPAPGASNNFTNPARYIVTAQNRVSMRDYMVTVIKSTSNNTGVPIIGGGDAADNGMLFPPAITSPYQLVNFSNPVSIQNEIQRLQNLIQGLLMQNSASQNSSTISTIPTGFRFNTNLGYGVTSSNVKYLQIMLNSNPDTVVAISGVGSPGRESSYFGRLTYLAVIKFQNKYILEISNGRQLTTSAGLVGPATRAKLNNLLGN